MIFLWIIAIGCFVGGFLADDLLWYVVAFGVLALNSALLGRYKPALGLAAIGFCVWLANGGSVEIHDQSLIAVLGVTGMLVVVVLGFLRILGLDHRGKKIPPSSGGGDNG